jgi:hypothetical protein
MPNGNPYMPRIFPKGVWEVGFPIPRYSRELAPYFIPTTAWQEVPIWNTKLGSYVSPSDIMDKDTAYGIHYSEFVNTLGCIKVRNQPDLVELVKAIKECYKRKEKVYLHVT